MSLCSASAAVNAVNSEKSGLVYEYFDFHKECSKMRYDRLSILVNRMAKYDFGYLAVEGEAAPGKKWNVTKKQEGAFRTNCMVCSSWYSTKSMYILYFFI